MTAEATERMVELLLAIGLASALPIALGVVAREIAVGGGGRLATGAALVAGALAGIGLLVERGWLGAVLLVPWIAIVGVVAVVTVARAAHIARETSPRDGASTLVLLVPIGFLVIGVSWLTFDRLGIRPIGFPTLIVLLTAVHFHVAGFFLALAGLRVLRARPSATVVAAVGAVAVGAPLTAFAFLGFATIGWIGALLVAAGGIGIGLGQILSASHVALGAARAALLVGGATLLTTMPLAAGYATGTTFGIPFLDVPAMAGIHGALNMLAFAIPTAFGWIAADRPTTGTPR